MARPMTHRWGKRINPAAAPTLLDEAAINKMLTPLHMAIELLPLGLFTQDHAEMIAKLINLMAVDSAGKGNGMWQIADAVGQVLIAMQARVDEGKSWNVTAQEREMMIENVMKMDKHLRAWTVRRFNINAMAVNEINNRAKAEGYKRGQRVEIQL